MLFAVATPMHMIAPVSAGTLKRRVDEEEHPDDARDAPPGSAEMMMNGSSHDWKLTTISR